MIAVLNCSKCWCQSNESPIPSTGGDSVTIAYSDLRIANAKMMQLKFANEKIDKLNSIVKLDSCEIIALKNNLKISDINNTKLRKQRNILGGISAASIISTIILIIK